VLTDFIFIWTYRPTVSYRDALDRLCSFEHYLVDQKIMINSLISNNDSRDMFWILCTFYLQNLCINGYDSVKHTGKIRRRQCQQHINTVNWQHIARQTEQHKPTPCMKDTSHHHHNKTE